LRRPGADDQAIGEKGEGDGKADRGKSQIHVSLLLAIRYSSYKGHLNRFNNVNTNNFVAWQVRHRDGMLNPCLTWAHHRHNRCYGHAKRDS
jgi:hypothetical protein